MAVNAIRIRPDDNVAVATEDIAAGEPLRMAQELGITARDEVPYGNKVALVTIPTGEPVIKYGECIGEAMEDIAPGQLVHTHNVKPLEIPDVLVEIT